jgi:hypothetical protein
MAMALFTIKSIVYRFGNDRCSDEVVVESRFLIVGGRYSESSSALNQRPTR